MSRRRPDAPEPLPDLLGLSLTELRRLDHPAVTAAIGELRDRLARPGLEWLDSGQEDDAGPDSAHGSHSPSLTR